MAEGQEKEAFWKALGGKGAYSTSPKLAVSVDRHSFRLVSSSLRPATLLPRVAKIIKILK